MFVVPCSLETLAPWGGRTESLVRERVRGSSGLSLRMVLRRLEGGGTAWGALRGCVDCASTCSLGPASAYTEGSLFLPLTKALGSGGPTNDRCQGTSRSVWGEDAFGQVIWELVGCLQGED